MPFPAPKDVQQKIDATLREFEAAWKSGDSKRVADTYTKDATVMPPGAPSTRGRSGVAGLIKEMLNSGAKKIELHIDELLAGDSTAQPAMVYSVANHTIYDADGAVIEKGKCCSLWQVEDGQWKMSHDMFSSDGPTPAK